MTETFKFAPNSQVPTTMAPDAVQGSTMNGWGFSSRPTVPYQKRFKLVLYGMRWYTDSQSDMFNHTIHPGSNARALELFYERHGVWKPFYWKHPHMGRLLVRFNAVVNVPEGVPNSGGLIDKVELTLIHHNPSF